MRPAFKAVFQFARFMFTLPVVLILALGVLLPMWNLGRVALGK